jgi:Ni,Fe-hydrogenase III large subunit/NADH:ubiquinone oxidoreductase subunit C
LNDAMGATSGRDPASRRALWVRNGEAARLAEVPAASPDEFAELCVRLCSGGGRLSALTALRALDGGARGARAVLAVLANDADSRLGLVRTEVAAGGRYPALTQRLPQAQAFERELYEQHGIRPEGHPWLKPLRDHDRFEPRAGTGEAGAAHPFFRVEGAGIHEVAVGPVHAGIIEPGHFRFQCLGEEVLHLEIQLGYQHRGAESLLLRSSPARRLAIAESIAGDTAVGHALAYCGVSETLAGAELPIGAQIVRGVALELERLANHVGDLGALCNDVGFLPGASWFGRLRGEFLNLLLQLSGNRFGRGLLRPGGARFGLAAPQRREFLARLAGLERELRSVADLTFGNESVGSRFEQTGVLSRRQAEELGLVGPVARACGCDRDVRRDHPRGIFRFAHVPVAVAESGDVMARARVRWLEAQRSLVFVREQLGELADPPPSLELPPPRAASLAVSLVEGWRGEIVHLGTTSATGELVDYRIVDPSFHNWLGLALAMRGNQISDFPLCNKSFNLSYAGHDL